MSEKLINEDQLRMVAVRSMQMSAQVAQSAADAIEEAAAKAVTMEQVNAAIQASAAGGGGSAGRAQEIYSEEEQVIGRWIDNRPLYRRTVEKKNMYLASRTNETLVFMQDCRIHRWYGYIEREHERYPLTYNTSPINLESQLGLEYYVWTYVYDDMLVLDTGYNFSLGTASAVVTIEYTKDADQPVSQDEEEETAGAVTMEQVNAAIQAAVAGAVEEAY